jgi:hypothetical protein
VYFSNGMLIADLLAGLTASELCAAIVAAGTSDAARRPRRIRSMDANLWVEKVEPRRDPAPGEIEVAIEVWSRELKTPTRE